MGNMNLTYNVTENIMINDILGKKILMSSRLKNKLIKNKAILLNGIFVDTRTVAHLGDVLTIILDLSEDNSNIVPSQIPLDIVYEDAHILIVNKPAGIAVHPSMLHFDNSLSNGVKYYFDSIGLHKKIRAVNRIDLNTSGLVLFAKNEYIHNKNNNINYEYKDEIVLEEKQEENIDSIVNDVFNNIKVEME